MWLAPIWSPPAGNVPDPVGDRAIAGAAAMGLPSLAASTYDAPTRSSRPPIPAGNSRSPQCMRTAANMAKSISQRRQRLRLLPQHFAALAFDCISLTRLTAKLSPTGAFAGWLLPGACTSTMQLAVIPRARSVGGGVLGGTLPSVVADSTVSVAATFVMS